MHVADEENKQGGCIFGKPIDHVLKQQHWQEEEAWSKTGVGYSRPERSGAPAWSSGPVIPGPGAAVILPLRRVVFYCYAQLHQFLRASQHLTLCNAKEFMQIDWNGRDISLPGVWTRDIC